MHTSVIVIGAGHTGLATSFYLRERGIDHVVLERGTVGHSWRTERWDSLRMLTPNWLNRLPGAPYSGPDPDGYMTMTDVASMLDSYAERIDAPVRTGVTVRSVRRVPSGGLSAGGLSTGGLSTDGLSTGGASTGGLSVDELSAGGDGPVGSAETYVVETSVGTFTAPAVVIATGACNIPKIPAAAAGVPESVEQISPKDYRNPAQLADGGVLVVGAAATGAQIAAELRESGREVTLAVGEHVRMPRTYRGRDILWWMYETGKWDERYDDLDDVVRARHLPSPQLVGTPDRSTLDLNYLTDRGVRLAGRLAGVTGGKAQFSGSLKNVVALADLKARRLLGMFDEWAREQGIEAELGAPEELVDTRMPALPPLSLDLTDGSVRTIVWATGYTADYSFLDIDGVLDRKGQLRHEGGIVAASPGLYRIGLPVLRHRNSTFLNGAEADARDLTEHLAAFLASRRPSVRPIALDPVAV